MLFTPIKPMLLHMGNEVIDDELWIYDIKWDGWRILLHKEGSKIEIYTRQGTNVTKKFPELQSVGRSIKVHSAIIDSEGVVLRNGVSDFEDFSYRGLLTNKTKIEEAMISHPATFVAFDVLATSKSHLKEPLIERKKRLSSMIEPSNELLITPSIQGNGSSIYELTKDRGMEGIVGKKANSTYQIDCRSYDWLKYKHFKLMDAVILGYKENPFTMIVGISLKNGRYKAIANLEFGFKPDEKAAFRQIAKQIITNRDKKITWVEPRLCCKVQYLEKTEKGLLRIASFKGFNFEVAPTDCIAI